MVCHYKSYLQKNKMSNKKSPLHEEHIKLKALMAPFAGWEMPIHYGSIIDETKHTRSGVSIFDISHMGELFVKEDPADSSLDKILTVPVVKMKLNSCRYGFLLNSKGGILDDLIVYRIKEDEWMIVVNASNEERDADVISKCLSRKASFENRSAGIVKIDVQGPVSPEIAEKIAGPAVKELGYYKFNMFDIYGRKHIISRTGYTGETGFEIYVDREKGTALWQELLNFDGVKPAGLGARDILRLEAGLPLYGHELTEDTTPLEGALERFLDLEKEFTGKKPIIKQKKNGIKRILAGFAADGRRTPRHENIIKANGREAGFVTSGVFSPHLNRGIGMGYIDIEHSREGADISIDTGKGEIAAKVTKMPFISKTSIKK